MKVWQFDPAQITTYYNYAVCDALARAGAEVTYFTSHYIYDDVIVPDNFDTEYLYFRGLNNGLIRRSGRLRKVLRGAAYPLGHLETLMRARRSKPDIVHLQWSRLPRFDKPLIKSIQAQGTKVVHTVHDIVPLFEHPKAAEAIGGIYAMCDALIVHAEVNRRELTDKFPKLNPARISVIPHVSLQRVFPVPQQNAREEARRYVSSMLKLPAEAILFVLFGNLKAYKGIDLLLEAFKEANKHVADVHLLLAGKVDDSLKIQTDRFEHIHLLSGYIPTSDMWKILMGVDVAVFPYRQITQSGALITAMGFGLPVIATNVGALPETIDSNGWVVLPNANDLTAAIIEAAERRAGLPNMGLRSLELIESRHAPEIVGKRFIDLYRQVLDS
jgi:glycosyltransferase involved in cell wall biosynthesis